MNSKTITPRNGGVFMNGKTFQWALAIIMLTGASLTAWGQSAGNPLPAELRPLHSRIQSMSHGYYSEQDWQQVFAEVRAVAALARQEGNDDLAIEAALLEAQAWMDMRGQLSRALEVLDRTRQTYAQSTSASMRKVFVREAEVYAQQGDQAAIRKLIDQFKASHWYQPERYPYRVGEGRNAPLSVVRPGSSGADSLVLTTMQNFLNAARFAPGNPCPFFSGVDRAGQPVSLDDYAGKVVLVDFWQGNWVPWRRNLAYQAKVFQSYQPAGFEVIGMALDADSVQFDSLLAESGATWRQLAPDPAIASQFGLHGEATSFLVDRDGVIIGRNLRGADLVLAIRRALDLGPGEYE